MQSIRRRQAQLILSHYHSLLGKNESDSYDSYDSYACLLLRKAACCADRAAQELGLTSLDEDTLIKLAADVNTVNTLPVLAEYMLLLTQETICHASSA